MKINFDSLKGKEMKALKRTRQSIKRRYDRRSTGVRLLSANIHENIATKRTKLSKDMNRGQHEKQNDENKKENWTEELDVRLDYFAATAAAGWILLPLNLFCFSSYK